MWSSVPVYCKLGYILQVKWSPEQLISEHVIFGDFFDLDNQTSVRVYRPITDQTKLTQTLEEFYMRMNFGNTKV